MYLRCLSDSKKICSFADVKLSFLINTAMNKSKIWQAVAEVLRILAALIAGYAGGTVL